MNYFPGYEHVFSLTVELDSRELGDPIRHPNHLGASERDARMLAQDYFDRRTYRQEQGVIRSVALHRHGELFDVYDGEWSHERAERLHADLEAMEKEERGGRRTRLPVLTPA